jgi:agarase
MRLLDAGADCAIRDRWLALVKEQYDSVEAFNDATGLSRSSWEAVRALRDAELPREGASGRLRLELENRYTEHYFSEVRRILKAADPNHLYMGCRYVQIPPRDEIVRIAGRHVDVMSVNCYSLVPDRARFQHWYDLSRRPIQIGEHQLAMFGARQHPPTWTAFTEQERRQWYPAYDETFARMPFSIGSHWFQWVDQCITGRPSNGENQMIGVVDITDQPHPEMVEAIRAITTNVYEWHAASE